MSNLVYRCFTKGSTKESGAPRRSQNWVTSRRAWFKVFDDHLECGDWSIDYKDIQRAVAYRTRSMFMAVTVLEVQTDEETYQFGFNPWAKPVEHLPIKVEEQQVQLRYSPFSIAARVFLAIYCGYLIWDWLS